MFLFIFPAPFCVYSDGDADFDPDGSYVRTSGRVVLSSYDLDEPDVSYASILKLDTGNCL